MELPRAKGVAAGGVEAAAGPAAPAVARFEVDPAAAAVADAPEEYALAAPLRDLVRKSVGRFLPDAAKGGKRAMRDAETWFAALDTINKQAKLLKVDDEYGGGRCLRCGPGQTRRDAKDAERGTDRPPFETMILMVRERRGGDDAEEKHVGVFSDSEAPKNTPHTSRRAASFDCRSRTTTSSSSWRTSSSPCRGGAPGAGSLPWTRPTSPGSPAEPTAEPN